MESGSSRSTAFRAIGVAMLLAVGCSGEQQRAAGSGQQATPAQPESSATVSAPPAATGPGGACPTYGLWRACSVEERIGRAGLAVKRRDEGIRHDFMRVEGLVFETSRAEVQVFLYASEAERKQDTDGLDTVTVAPHGRRIIWRWPATLVTSQNMAAIVLSLNPRQAERISLALGAGLPAPPR